MLHQARSRAVSRLPAPCHVVGRICAGYSTDLLAAGSHDQIARRGSGLDGGGTGLLPCDAAGTSASPMEIASAPAPISCVASASSGVDDRQVVSSCGGAWRDAPWVARRSAGVSADEGLAACSSAAAAALALTPSPLHGSHYSRLTTLSPRSLHTLPPQHHHHHRSSALHSAPILPHLRASAQLSPLRRSVPAAWSCQLAPHSSALRLPAPHAPRPACAPFQLPTDTWRGSSPFHAPRAAAAAGKHQLHQLSSAYHSAASTDGSQAASKYEEVGPVDPFSLVADELTGLADRMRAMILSEIPKLATAADYFFRVGATGKRFRPTVILLMASSLERVQCAPAVALPGIEGMAVGEVPVGEAFTAEERKERQRRIAEITEMIHVASLLHDDVLDHADTRRGVSSLNYMMGNKLAVLAGDFLLARASAALAGLRNTEVVELLSAVLEHLVGGEVMQMTAEPTQCSSMDYYMRKTFLKTASLIANSCKAVAVLGGHDAATAQLAYDYGQHLGLAFQLVDDALDFTGSLASLGKPALNDITQGLVTAPVLFAAESHPGMHRLMDRKFSQPGDVQQAVAWVEQSGGVARTKALAAEHCALAVRAVQAMPPAHTEYAHRCRLGLVQLTQLVLSRSK
ncbi:hypothetical protein CLOM_g22878 [Closterium sp. NIES-68]|nr:hypothetical protein CLOM_g22878 [Closterium sp. NIES-68]GJP77137.1 hypothetical protein CLOP_g7569 [Closterium sp. NIES-67]